MTATCAKQKLKSLASSDVAKSSARLFKLGPRKGGECVIFIGAKVPVLRKAAHEFRSLPLEGSDRS
jgi:hypothetical protein